MISYTIPGTQYRNPEDVNIPYLTDVERQALSYAHFDKQFEVREFEDMAGKTDGGVQVLSGWKDVTSQWDAARFASLREAMHSLDRLGLVAGRYDNPATPTRERVIETTDDGHFRVPATGWRYRLTDLGREQLAEHLARWYKCCDGCVRLNCVCSERTFCAEHGGGCHGTHD